MDDHTIASGDAESREKEPLLNAHTKTSGIPDDEILIAERSSHTTSLPPPTPTLAPTAPHDFSSPANQSEPSRDDIKNILKAIPLPERRGEADIPAKAIPPALSLIEKNEQIPEPETEIAAAKDNGEEKRATHGGAATSWLVAPLRTLREDLQQVIKDRKISIVRAVALEEDKKKETRVLTPQEHAAKQRRQQRSFSLIFASGVLLFLGAAALLGVYVIEHQGTPTIAIGDSSSLIFSEMSVDFPLQDQSSGDIKRVIAQSRTSGAALGSITRIIPSLPAHAGDTGSTAGPRPATTAEFLHALDAHVSDELIRALGDTFFLGIHTIDKDVPVLVISVTSYDHAFAGMLAWEDSMNSDLTPIFPPVSPTTADESGLPTSRTFQDIVLRNYDVRALKDDEGTIELYYSFPTPNLLIIAESPHTFTEVLSRLQAERKL